MSVQDSQPVRHGVVGVIVRNQQFLVIRRSVHVVAPGALCFPGGGIERGESDEEALTREIREELGVLLKPIRCLWRSQTKWNVRLSWWLGQFDGPDHLTPNPAEVESVHWFTAAELLKEPDLLQSNREFLAAVQEGRIALDERGPMP